MFGLGQLEYGRKQARQFEEIAARIRTLPGVKQFGGRNWAFYGESCDEEGKSHRVRVLLASRTPIQRHVKVKAEANPYDPADETYFEKREGDHMAETFRGTRTLRFLWYYQRGLCPICNTKITRITEWRLHYCVPRVLGGSTVITAFWFIQSATTGFTVSVFSYHHRVSLKEAFEGPEPDDGKLSRPVLRGPAPSNGGWLLGEQYERNQAMIAANANMKSRMEPKTGRGGRALLAGLLRCRRCGRMLHVEYAGRNPHQPRYHCHGAQLSHGEDRCISFGGWR